MGRCRRCHLNVIAIACIRVFKKIGSQFVIICIWVYKNNGQIRDYAKTKLTILKRRGRLLFPSCRLQQETGGTLASAAAGPRATPSSSAAAGLAAVAAAPGTEGGLGRAAVNARVAGALPSLGFLRKIGSQFVMICVCIYTKILSDYISGTMKRQTSHLKKNK
jgi:hypothetical protein